MKVRITTILTFLTYMVMSQADISSLYNEALDHNERGDIAEAVYNLEMASLAKPFDKEIANNLKIIKTKVPVDIVELDSFFLTRWYHNMASILTPGGWKYLSIIVLLGILSLLFLKYGMREKGESIKSLHIAVSIILLILTIAMGYTRESLLTRGPYVVVMQDVSYLKEGPDEVSEDIKEISKGVKLEILDSSEEWYKVSAMDKEQGWILKDKVKRLQF